MLQLHFYSNYAGRLVLNNEYHDWWSFDTYPLESIKEFEQISQAWKTFLADLLRRGLSLKIFRAKTRQEPILKRHHHFSNT